MPQVKVLVVGEAPSRWMEENGVTLPLPLARRELACYAGITPPRFDELFECVNVLDKWPGKEGKGDAFPLALAKIRAFEMLENWAGRRVVLLGQRVSSAFLLRDPYLFNWRPFEWTIADGSKSAVCEMAICPHPSGVNRWWNKAENRRAAAMFWGELVKALESAQFHKETGGMYR